MRVLILLAAAVLSPRLPGQPNPYRLADDWAQLPTPPASGRAISVAAYSAEVGPRALRKYVRK